ncbi:hypothetical protein QYF36_016071 [Acer negundo]|nr:hypothetical protein QYF36_016071 [Acer negundo]
MRKNRNCCRTQTAQGANHGNSEFRIPSSARKKAIIGKESTDSTSATTGKKAAQENSTASAYNHRQHNEKLEDSGEKENDSSGQSHLKQQKRVCKIKNLLSERIHQVNLSFPKNGKLLSRCRFDWHK